MPFSTAEAPNGGRLIGADRATWVRLGIALFLGVGALAAPHIGGTAASFTDTTTVDGTLSTCWDFSKAPACPPPPAEPTTEPDQPAQPAEPVPPTPAEPPVTTG